MKWPIWAGWHHFNPIVIFATGAGIAEMPDEEDLSLASGFVVSSIDA
jgi:hypothetical protein